MEAGGAGAQAFGAGRGVRARATGTCGSPLLEANVAEVLLVADDVKWNKFLRHRLVRSQQYG